MSSEFIDALAAMKVEESYPKQTARFDVLTDRESGGLTADEQEELNGLNAMLEMEMKRCRLHYSVNWHFMTPEIKQKHRDEVQAWKDRLAKRAF